MKNVLADEVLHVLEYGAMAPVVLTHNHGELNQYLNLNLFYYL